MAAKSAYVRVMRTIDWPRARHRVSTSVASLILLMAAYVDLASRLVLDPISGGRASPGAAPSATANMNLPAPTRRSLRWLPGVAVLIREDGAYSA